MNYSFTVFMKKYSDFSKIYSIALLFTFQNNLMLGRV